jgi:hypothetical protein
MIALQRVTSDVECLQALLRDRVASSLNGAALGGSKKLSIVVAPDNPA